jgi:hypothetical protein
VRKWVLGAALASGVLEKLVPRYGLVLQLAESGKPLFTLTVFESLCLQDQQMSVKCRAVTTAAVAHSRLAKPVIVLALSITQ